MVIQADRVFEGCSIRGLPIGVPFRTEVSVPEHSDSDLKNLSNVFIISQFKDMQGDQEIVDIIPHEEKYNIVGKQCVKSIQVSLPSDNELNANHPSTVDGGNNPDDWSDVESITVEPETLSGPKVDISNDMGFDSDVSLEMNCSDMCTSDMLSNLTREKLKQKLKQNTKQVETITNYILSGSKKRKKSKSIKHVKTEGGFDVNFSLPRKLKKIDTPVDDTDNSRRRSARNSSLGFRPDYKAIEAFSDDDNGCSNSEFNDTQYDTKYNNVDDNMYLLKTAPGEDDGTATTSMNNIDEVIDIKPSIDELKKVMSGKTKLAGIKKKPRMGPKSKVRKMSESNHGNEDKVTKNVEDEDPDFIPAGVNNIEVDDDDANVDDEIKNSVEPKLKKIRKRKRKMEAEINGGNEGSEKGPLDTTSKGKRQRGRPRLDPTVRQFRRLEARKKAAERAKIREAKAPKKPKKEVTEEDENKEKPPSFIERLKLQKAIAKQEKAANRIKIKLQDHQDMFRMDFMESYERRNRGKSVIETGLELYVCAICDKYKTDNKEALEMHLEMHANGELTCDKCGWVGCYIGELLKHKRDVHKNNIWICDECGMECSGQDGLKDHLGKDHDRPQYPCKHCEEKGNKHALPTLNLFRKHLRTDHADKMIPCEGCKKLFATQGQITRHLSLGCEGDGPREYPCDKCGKTFTSQHGVHRHIDRVHNKIRSFPCPKCSFTAARPSGLNQHLLVHAGYHPFKCDQCSFSCVQKYQLKSHMRTHTGEKPYKCSECNYAAAWKVQLKEHMKIHNVTNTVYCNECGQVFRDYRSFKAHQSKEHGPSGHVHSEASHPEQEESSSAPAHPHQPEAAPFHHQVQPFPEDLSLAQHFTSMPYFQPYN